MSLLPFVAFVTIVGAMEGMASGGVDGFGELDGDEDAEETPSGRLTTRSLGRSRSVTTSTGIEALLGIKDGVAG